MADVNEDESPDVALPPPEPERRVPLLTKIRLALRAFIGAGEVAFLAGVGLIGWGLYGIWWPLAPTAIGGLLVGMAVYGALRTGIEAEGGERVR
jgi:hypothetical protein